jgi:hypothetical protein
MDTFNVHPNNTETIKPVCQMAKWHPSIKVCITPSKDIAIQEEDPTFIKMFSDSSGIEGNIGAAAVLYHYQDSRTTKQVLQYCLGPETRHTVYEGEVVGRIMAQELLHKKVHGFGCHISMYIDNQASIRSTQPAPSHYLVDILHDKISWTNFFFATSTSLFAGSKATLMLRGMKKLIGKPNVQQKATLIVPPTGFRSNSTMGYQTANQLSNKQ